MDKSTEEIIRDRIKGKSGKDFQQLFWDIMHCIYNDFQSPRMRNDLGNDGYSIKNKSFFAVYAPESEKYDNKETIKKIENNNPKDLGDYNKFCINWKHTNQFENWIFVVKDNLMGTPHLKITELNGFSDGIKKEIWGIDKLVNLCNKLDTKDLNRIFNLPSNSNNLGLEISTIIDLISYISKNAELTDEGFINNIPDPQKKLERFGEHLNDIKHEIQNFAIYAKAQKEAKNVVGIDGIKSAKINLFLQSNSLRFLKESNNNPMQALDKFTLHIHTVLKNESSKEYDENAIRYYLIGEIPQCNLFPNPKIGEV